MPTPFRTLVRSLLVALSGLAIVGSADALTLKLDETLDLTSPTASGAGYAFYEGTPAFSASKALTLDVGDSLEYTVQFMQGQSLSLQNIQYLWGYVGTSSPATVTSTGEMELLDAAGNVVLTSNLKTDTETMAHFGEAFVAADFVGGLPGATTFSGVRYIGTVDSYGDGSTTRTYDTPGFAYLADPATEPVSGSVPEPASVAMMLAGLAGLWAGRRGRRSRAA